MTKATTSAIDFLAAISGGTELFDVGGATVELRSLTFAEVQKLNTDHSGNSTELAFQSAALGIVTPKLDEAQLQQLRGAKPGVILDISKRVMRLSGMGNDETTPDSPLAGGGSSPDPTTEQPT